MVRLGFTLAALTTLGTWSISGIDFYSVKCSMLRGVHTLFGGLGATPFTEIPYKNTFLLLNNETWFPKQGIRFVIDVEHMYRSVGCP